ncbi:MAG: two-component system response regulator [Pyrinomonas sp.]|mgnify:CR=1 FL=1|uniref:sigma-54-dependent transcriptional regulator n=1 Tax=Pyrinomonas sp. TaxID=2080306 RepID=UPI00332A8317
MSHPPRIIVVDDDPVTCDLLCEVFAREGFATLFAQSGEEALRAVEEFRPDVLVSDIRMKTRLDGLMLLDHLRRDHPSLPVILMTAFGSIETAIRAVKDGAFDYVSKPFDIDALVATVRRALDMRRASGVARAEEAGESESPSELVGRTPTMLEVYKLIARVSDAPTAVLITGESGTGKELVARAIHTHSARRDQPFVPVNCGALTETLLESELFGHVKGAFTGAISNKRGIFELAGHGTVFLDEVSEMSPNLQVKLLRVLQEREVIPVGGSAPVRVNARIIAASNRDLEELVERGAFRHDLFFRLNVIQIALPPLRQRREDIPLLVTHFLRKHTPPGRCVPTIAPPALDCLLRYVWPGNVRELENTIERAVTLDRDGTITVEDLPPRISAPTSAPSQPSTDTADKLTALFADLPSLAEMERRYLLYVLEATGGNRKRAAEILRINRKTLYRMAARHRLELGS